MNHEVLVIETIEDLFRHTDWPLLRKQKLLLIQAEPGRVLSVNDTEDMEGLLHYLDFIMDLAADQYGFPVYPEDTEEESS